MPSFDRFSPMRPMLPDSVSPGRCRVRDALMPVPRLVGHWVR